MKKITRIISAVLSTALLASIVTVAPFSVGATETDRGVSVAYSEESTEAIPESPLEQATELSIEEATVESHITETTVAQTIEETTAVPKTQNSSKTIEPVGASAGESVSANGIENKINTLSQAFANAEITHFTNNGEAAGSEEWNCYLPNINDSLSKAGLPTGAEAVNQGASAGYSCYGFASYVFWYLYGSNFVYAPSASTPSYGDLLEFNGAHYAIYLGERNGNYYVYDSNWDYQCSMSMHEISKSWNTPVTIYHASNYAQVFDSEPPKTGGHVDFQRGTIMQGTTPINTFVLKYTATDNIGVSRVYAHVWEFGKTEDQAATYEGALSGQNVTITIPQSEMPESTYSIECYAEDATGNRASIGVKRTYFPIYKVIEDTGTYQVTADTAPVRHSPYEKINGKSTDCGQYHKGLKVSITGYYINSYGNKWYQLDNTNWIYSGNVKKCFQWSDVWNAINPFVGKNEKFYYFSDQAIMAGETVSSKSGASVGACADEDSSVGAQNYIRVTGTCPEYYSVNGSSSTYYTITFDANGGSLSTTSKTVVGGTAMGYSPIPYRLGYQFDGWFTAAEEGVQYTSDTVVSGNITLYAHWTRIVLLEGYCGDNLYFILYADGGLEFSGYGDMTSHPWTKNYSKRVYEVSMPQKVTSLCASAFEGCQYMLPFKLPDITIIPNSTFRNCYSFDYISIPCSVTRIERFAFSNCNNLSRLEIPDELIYLGRQAFGNCISLTQIQIPKSLQTADTEYNNLNYIFDGPFYKCSNIKNIEFEQGTTIIADYLFSGCDGLTEVSIPNTVTKIGRKAFGGCISLESIILPSSLTSIDFAAFASCESLKSIIIPDNVTSISYMAFLNCKNLSEVVLSKGLSKIGRQAFGYCTSLTQIQIPKSLQTADTEYNNLNYIFDGPFYKCSNIKNIEFEQGTAIIADYLFSGCDGLTEVSIPNTVTKIGRKAFGGCISLESIVLPSSLTSIDFAAFASCESLKSIIIPDSVASISYMAFLNCKNLSEVVLSKGLSKIGRQAFGYCTSLTQIQIPKSLQTADTEYNNLNYIFDGPFYKCSNIKNIEFEQGTTIIADYLFSGCDGLTEVSIPNTVTKIGRKAFGGCISLESIVLPSSLTSIDFAAFASCESLKSIIIPDSVISIESYTFLNCKSLKKAKLPNTRQIIMAHMFENCNNLEEVISTDSVLNIQEYAFSGCASLKKFHFSSNLTNFAQYAFFNTAIEKIDIPNKVTSIGNNAFENSAIKTLTIPNSVKTISAKTFHNCEFLESVEIRDYSLKEIPDSAFMDCPSIKSMVLPKGLTKISNLAFANDTGLTEVEIPESVTTIATNAFSYPDIMTVYGYTESYAKQYCDEKGINFVDNHVLSQGIALDQTHCTGEDYIIMDIGETNEIKFEVYPLNSNDVISLASDNTRVTINGMHITSKYAGDSVITATATSGVEYTFTIHNRSVKNVSIKTLPENLKVTQGNELDLTGFELQVNYNDNSNAVTDNYTISGFDKDTIGVQTITVLYVGTNGSTYKTAFNVEVVDPRGNLTGISIKQYPQKLKYVKYDALDLSGLIVVENYDSGLEIEITDYKVTGYNALKLGKQTIKITKGEYTLTFEVEVTEKPVYAIGDTNLDGIVSIRDVTAIQRHIAELELFSDEQLALADTNGDGEINISDATHLQMYLAEYDVVLGKQ